jgi:hypothetical protein
MPLPWGREPNLPPIRPPLAPVRRKPTAPGPNDITPAPATRTPTHPGPDAPLIRRTPTMPAEDL